MKQSLALFLGVFVFMLSVSDVLVETVSHNGTMAIESCESGADGQDHCPQGCSPFHACCICLGFTVASTYSVSKFIPTLKNVFYILYTSIIANSFSGKIWQPPKIS